MKWIRNPSYDLFWFLSAPLVLMMPLPALLTINFSHAIAPIVLAWNHRSFRAVMLQRPMKFMGWPALVMAVGVAAAIATWVVYPMFVPQPMALENIDLDQVAVPVVVWANLYAAWNLYHAGAQNFGFLCLYRRKRLTGRARYAVLTTSVLIVVIFGHEAGRIFSYQAAALLIAGLLSANHWLAEVGLSAHVHARHRECSPLWFIGAVILMGFLLLLAFDIGLWYSARAAMLALCLRGALGMWHFLQDRWIWQLSNPQVRATIGRDLMR